MRYCSQCGSPIPDGAGFCGKCGAPAAPQKTAAPGKPAAAAVAVKSKTPLIVGAAAVAAVIVVAIVLISVLVGRSHSSPAQQFISYQQELLSRAAAPVRSAGEAVKKDIKTDVTYSASVDSPRISFFLDGTSFTMKMDANQDRALINEQIALLGSTVLNATITFEDGMLGFYLPELDENYYVLDATDILTVLQDEFGRYLSSANINAGDVGNPLPAVLELLASGKADDLVQALRPYLSTLLTLVTDENVTRQENVPVTFSQSPQTVPCTVYTFTPGAEDAERVFNAIADQLEKDKNLRSVLQDLVSSLLELEPDLLAGAPVDSPDQLVDEAIGQVVQIIRDSAPSIARQYDDRLDLTWTLAVEGDEVRQIAVDVTDLATAQTGGLAYESLVLDGGQRSQCLAATGDGMTMPLVTVLTAQADGHSSGTVILELGVDTVEVRYDVQPDKRSPLGIPYGEYSLYTQDMPVELDFTVADGANGGADHTITVTGDAEMFGGYFSELALTMNVTDGTSAVWPDAAPVDITDYTPEQLEALVGSLAEALENDVMGNLGALFING